MLTILDLQFCHMRKILSTKAFAKERMTFRPYLYIACIKEKFAVKGTLPKNFTTVVFRNLNSLQ